MDLPHSFQGTDLSQAYAYPAEGPWLRANMITSLDGAAWWDERTGPLGNEADRTLFALMRALADVVIVGAGTVRAEGYGPVRPRREWEALRRGRSAVPPLAVVSRSLSLDFDAPIFTAATEQTILITTESAPASQVGLAKARADVIVAGRDSVDFGQAVRELVARGHSRLLCEGGPTVLSEVAAAGVLDELCLTLSPVLLAGDPARILDGAPLPEPGRFRLRHVLQEDDFLFLRYVARRT